MTSVVFKVDYDAKPFPRKQFNARIINLCKTLKLNHAIVELRATRKGTHAKVTLSDCAMNNSLITATQLYLMSDPHRELFNIGRIYHNQINRWNVLFAAKWRGGQLISKEGNPRRYTIKINEKEN